MEKEKGIKRIKTAGIIALVFLALYIPSLLHWIYGGAVTTGILGMGTFEDSVNASACLVRNENVIKSQYNGKCIVNIKEGERVANKAIIATVADESSELLIKDLKALDIKILEMGKKEIEKKSIFSEDIKRIEDNIQDGILKLATESNLGTFASSGKAADEVNELLQKKITVSGGFGTSGSTINNEIKNRDELLKKISRSKKAIAASKAGTVSYFIDGYEGKLKPSLISNITNEFINSIKTGRFAKSATEFTVQASEYFIKIIPDYSYYYVLALEPQYASKYKINDDVIIRVNEINREYGGKISYISGIKDGRNIIAIYTDEGLSETTVFRKTNVDLIKCTSAGSKQYKGIKVPVKSLVNIDKQNRKADIVLVKANYASIRKVHILIQNDDYAIIESSGETEAQSVSLYDTYVINPGNIEEGQMVN